MAFLLLHNYTDFILLNKLIDKFLTKKRGILYEQLQIF